MRVSWSFFNPFDTEYTTDFDENESIVCKSCICYIKDWKFGDENGRLHFTIFNDGLEPMLEFTPNPKAVKIDESYVYRARSTYQGMNIRIS